MKLYITGDISEEHFGEFSHALEIAENEGAVGNFGKVNVELCSTGGLPEAALAYSSRIRDSPLNVNIHVYGSAQSAAVLVLAAGDHRSMDRHAFVLVHESSLDGDEAAGTVSHLERKAKQLRAAETQWNDLMAFMTKASAETWAALHKEETILSPKQCLELGLIDEIT